jgi:two-component system chemotaxis response regulator CheY
MTKVLVVDDSGPIRTVLSRILEGFGYQVSQAQHGKEALAFLLEHPDTQLALVDWNMPEMTGLELVEAVRRQSALSGLRVMMVTTESDFDQMERALKAGADEYTVKPFTRQMIADKLQRLGFAAGS